MNYTLTVHARRTMHERRIDPEWLERAVNSPERILPDPTDPTLAHHIRRIPEHGNRVLRVILNNTVHPPRIVTLYFDRALSNRP